MNCKHCGPARYHKYSCPIRQANTAAYFRLERMLKDLERLKTMTPEEIVDAEAKLAYNR